MFLNHVKIVVCRNIYKYMSHEREGYLGGRKPTAVTTRPTQERIIFKVKKLGTEIIRPPFAKVTEIFINRVERKVVDRINPEYAEGFDTAFKEAMQDSNVLAILISNHEGHADAISTAVISRRLTRIVNEARSDNDQFRGFMLTTAASLETGHQNLFLQEAIKQAKKKLPKYNLSTQPFVRKADRERYGIISDNSSYMKELMEIVGKGVNRSADGLAFYPQGSVESGRRIKKGKNKNHIKGMQRLNCNELYSLIEIIEARYHRKVLLIPIGSHGAGNVINPDHRRPTLKTVSTLANKKPKSLMSVKVGVPIKWDDLKKQIKEQKGQEATSEDLGDVLGRIIASLLPSDARGIYS
jgi:hypothetical protein